MKNFSFFDIFRQAWRLSFSYAALTFGLLIACLLTAIAITSPSPPFSSVPSHDVRSILVCLIFFLIFLFSKSSLILLFDRAIQKKLSKKINLPHIWRGYRRALFLGVLTTSFVLIIIATFSLPLFLFWLRTGELSSALLSLSLFTFLPLAVFISLIQEFSFCYFLLSPLSARDAIENSLRLFSRHTVLSIRFLLFILAIGLLFTFSANLVMLGVVTISQKMVASVSIASPLMVVLQALCIGWFYTLEQALWVLFFHHLAIPKDPPLTQKEDILLEESVGETTAI